MTIQQVNDARKNSGPDASGFVINIAEHKTNKAFGYAQIYLDPTVFSWLERWIELRAQLNPKSNLVFISGSKTPAKNMVKYLQLVWTEMGLPGRPTFIDIQSAVATHAKNFHPPEIRSRLSAVMCHDTATADKFYVRHLNMEQSLEIRRLFEEATHGASAPGPSATSLPEPRVPAKPRSGKRKRRVSVSESSSSEEEAEVPYQESGSSALEEEMEDITRARRRLAKKREGDGKEEEDDDDDDDEQEQEQGEKDQQEEEDQQQQEEDQQEEEDLKKAAKATQSEGTKRKALYKKVVVTLSPLKSQLKSANKATSQARRALLRAEKRRNNPLF
ncbi:hypothetical protein GOODEAATRI_033965 [Goodea atripinnis]|uniref:Uncharacterized protein n=1 Tax=Goodea atripinnis TaxID=208336 RepID=A0ABV0PJC4_9TELE